MRRTKTLILSLILSPLLFGGCQLRWVDEESPQHYYNVTNLEDKFVRFWAQAQSQPLERQIQLWDEIIEADHKEFYNSLVWGKGARKNWQKRKREKLKESFEIYNKNYEVIVANFKSFETTLIQQIEKYKALFPDARFDLPIYAVPSANTFNGKAGALEGKPEVTVLAFGIDTIIHRKDDVNVLYSHELFHVYHTTLLSINETTFKKAKMTLPLWLEGFATYTSAHMNPKASESDILLDKNLAQSTKDIPWLKKEFLSVAQQPAWNKKDMSTYYTWFSSGKHKSRPELPGRTGYLLGYKVVRELAKKHSLPEMVKWTPEKFHQMVVDQLSQ